MQSILKTISQVLEKWQLSTVEFAESLDIKYLIVKYHLTSGMKIEWWYKLETPTSKVCVNVSAGTHFVNNQLRHLRLSSLNRFSIWREIHAYKVDITRNSQNITLSGIHSIKRFDSSHYADLLKSTANYLPI